MSLAPPSTARTKTNRLPAPALFVGPPSHNASALSLPHPPDSPTTTTNNPSNEKEQSGTLLDLTRPPTNPKKKQSKSSLEAQWSELQRTLDEVELAADSRRALRGGTGTAFGPGHAKALEELRDAQRRLAEAWSHTLPTEEEKIHIHTTSSGEGRRDGEAELRNANERRKRNEEYFALVKGRVGEVVERLGEVSGAMRKVEGEGREMWDDEREGLERVETGVTESGRENDGKSRR